MSISKFFELVFWFGHFLLELFSEMSIILFFGKPLLTFSLSFIDKFFFKSNIFMPWIIDFFCFFSLETIFSLSLSFSSFVCVFGWGFNSCEIFFPFSCKLAFDDVLKLIFLTTFLFPSKLVFVFIALLLLLFMVLFFLLSLLLLVVLLLFILLLLLFVLFTSLLWLLWLLTELLLIIFPLLL